MRNFFEIYDCLIDSMGNDASEITAGQIFSGKIWAMATVGPNFGIALKGESGTAPLMFENGLQGLSLKEAAQAAKSWNLVEAGMGMAVINAYYNTPERMESLHCAEPFDNYCTAGLSFRDKTVGVVGHLHLTPEIHKCAKKIYILERAPQDGDYPDSACEELLPRCDIVLITGSTLTNKTLPRLIELTRDSLSIIVGPSVPMCPALLDFGINRLSGMVVSDIPAMHEHVENGVDGSPYPFGKSFLLKH